MLKLQSMALTTLPHGFSVRTSLWEARAKRGRQEFRWPWCCHDNTLYLHRGEGASSQVFKGPFSCNNLGSSSLPMMTAEVSKSLNGSSSPVCVLSKFFFFFFSFEAVRKVEFVRSFHAVLKSLALINVSVPPTWRVGWRARPVPFWAVTARIPPRWEPHGRPWVCGLESGPRLGACIPGLRGLCVSGPAAACGWFLHSLQ